MSLFFIVGFTPPTRCDSYAKNLNILIRNVFSGQKLFKRSWNCNFFSCSSRQTVLNLKSETEIRNRNEKGRAEERVGYLNLKISSVCIEFYFVFINQLFFQFFGIFSEIRNEEK
jgi:hypothetical protein